MDRSAEITNRDAGPPPFPAAAAAVSEPEERQRKRRKTTHGGSSPSFLPPPPPPPTSRWRTGWEQQVFLSKLLSALRRVRSGASSSSSSPAVPRSRAVRDAADRILAVAAGGRSRWSRAVLRRHITASRKTRVAHPEPRGPTPVMAALLERERMKRVKKRPGGGGGWSGNASILRAKAKVLGRLVPGCRKTSFPSLLEETSDYIAALEMQIRAMSALATMLTSIGSGNGTLTGSSAGDPSRLS